MTPEAAIIEIDPWLQSPAGRYLLEWEQAQFDRAVADIFGYHALQVGLPQLDATVQFNERPAWQERLDWIARHGLPFARLRDNRDSQLVVGMHPDGYFGVFLTPRTR